MKRGLGEACGKIILTGDHSVVYGKLSLALPLRAVSTRVIITPSRGKSTIECDLYSGAITLAPDGLLNLKILLDTLNRDYHKLEEHIHIDIKSTIPTERGVGSSAAVAIAFVRAFFAYYKIPLSEKELLFYADLAETISHGNPSGLDVRLISHNQALAYQKDQSLEEFHFHTPFWLLVADSGIDGNTKAAVSDVGNAYHSHFPSRRLSTRRIIDRMGIITEKIYKLLANTHNSTPASKDKDLFIQLRNLFAENHQALQSLQVSSPELDEILHYIQTHSQGAGKLTGGGRGGCTFSLCQTKEEALRLEREVSGLGLAADTWLLPFSSEGGPGSYVD